MLKVKIVLALLLMVGVAGGYAYYQKLQKDIAILKANNEKLNFAVKTQKQAMNQMKKDIGEVNKVNRNLLRKERFYEKKLGRLDKKFHKDGRDIGKFMLNDTEKASFVINRASDFRNRCVQLLTGDKVKKEERNVPKKQRNSLCPELFNYPTTESPTPK